MLIQDSDNDIIEYLNPTEKSLEMENFSFLLITYRDTIQQCADNPLWKELTKRWCDTGSRMKGDAPAWRAYVHAY